LAIALVTFAAIFAGVGLLLPGRVHVERPAAATAQPGQIFPHLNNLHKFNAWSPSAARDTATKYAFTGPEAGGTRVTWTLDSAPPFQPLARWFGLAFPSFIGKDHDEGLARLKARVEKGTAG
jgi:hypothetical protein